MEKQTSYGKIILVGEHAVQFNKPAIALPLRAVSTKTTITKGDTFTLASSFGLSDDESSIKEHEGITKMVIAFFNKYNVEERHIAIKTSSTSPVKSGLGSSAQSAHSVIVALANYYNIELSKKELFKFIQLAENYHHANSSGIDAMTIINNAPTYYNKRYGNKVLNIDFEGFIVVATTDVKSMSEEAVTVVKDYSVNHYNEFKRDLKNFKKESKLARKALLENNYNLLKSSMINTQILLENIGVSDYKLETLLSVATQSGASAAKVTGGGIGGSIIALSKNRDVASIIANKLEENGATNTYIIDLKTL